jgi:hypothetical protein
MLKRRAHCSSLLHYCRLSVSIPHKMLSPCMHAMLCATAASSSIAVIRSPAVPMQLPELFSRQCFEILPWPTETYHANHLISQRTTRRGGQRVENACASSSQLCWALQQPEHLLSRTPYFLPLRGEALGKGLQAAYASARLSSFVAQGQRWPTQCMHSAVDDRLLPWT